jgi:P pilus assembly chaperone PapD
MKSLLHQQHGVSQKVSLFLTTIISGVILFSCTLPVHAIAQGNLLITPVRVVFEGQRRMQELNLANTGSDSAKYLISFIEIRMNENGTFEKINEPDSGQHFASKNLRFFPRSVTLAPGEAQLVKVQLTKTSQLTTGEYRSHIYFRAVPDEKPLGEKIPVKDSTGISVKLISVFGISIPVIIRIGESTTNVSLSDLSLDLNNDSLYRFNMAINRTGNFSVYGDITINYISPQGKITKMVSLNGLAVYTPTTVRRFHFDLTKKYGINFHKGKLEVVYSTKKNDTDVIVLAKEAILLK